MKNEKELAGHLCDRMLAHMNQTIKELEFPGGRDGFMAILGVVASLTVAWARTAPAHVCRMALADFAAGFVGSRIAGACECAECAGKDEKEAN